MIQTKRLKTPLYGTRFEIVIYDNDGELQKKFNDVSFEPPITEFDGGVFKHNDVFYLVLFYDGKKPTYGVIAHESKHLVNEIFIDIQHELDRYNDEPECYLLGWVVDRVHELLTKFKNGKSD